MVSKDYSKDFYCEYNDNLSPQSKEIRTSVKSKMLKKILQEKRKI